MPASQESVSERLAALKQRSGRSYEWLARRTHSSRSTLQRYCAGTATPATFGVVESFALACGAGEQEIAELFAAWNRERAAVRPVPDEAAAEPGTLLRAAADPAAGPEHRSGSSPAPPAGAEPPAEPAAGPEPLPGQEPQARSRRAAFPPVPVAPVTAAAVEPAVAGVAAASPAPSGAAPSVALLDEPERPGRGPVPRPVLAGLGVLLVVVATAGALLGLRWLRPAVTPPGTGAGAAVAITADPVWNRAEPLPVQRTFFGVTLNSGGGEVPGFPVGAVRLWDSGTRWAQFEPRPGQFDWSALDRHVDGARAAGLPVLFTFGAAPAWANPDAPRSAYPEGAKAAPPLDLADWDEAVRAVVTRYAGKIEAYELWPIGNDQRFFNGSLATLVEMTRRAARILRSVDPAATVVCPGMGNLWTAEGQRSMTRFAEAGGFDVCDVAGIKLFQRQQGDPPESMTDLLASVDRVLHAAGAQPRIWVTGTSYAISQQPPVPAALTRAYATRYFLTGLYARPQNLERMYFYSWGGGPSRLPLVLQAEGQPPTPAGLAVARLEGWLSGSRIVGCGHGAAIGVPEAVWQCRFRFDSPVAGGAVAVVRWTREGRVSVPATAGQLSVTDLDGRTTQLHPGTAVPLGPEPVLIREQG